MGIISDRINTIIPKVFSKIEEYKRLERFNKGVLDAFYALKPLARQEEVVTNSYYTGLDHRHLYVKDWLYTYSYATFTPDYITAPSDFLNCIREYGKEIAKYVREEIREPFDRLLELANKLKMYKRVHTLTVNKQVAYYLGYQANLLGYIQANEISMRADEIDVVRINTPSGQVYSLNLTAIESIVTIDDIVSEIIELQEKVIKDIEEVNKANANIVKEMRWIVLPYKLAKDLQ